MKKNILIIGAGAREHAIGWKLLQSEGVGTLYFAPGNGGTRNIGKNVPIGLDDVDGLLQHAKRNHIDLTIVGSEVPLAAGIVDRFTREGLRIFGPTRAAARLETSKAWASEFMKRHGLPVPQFEIFQRASDAQAYVKKLDGNCVIKADGLCQGKGVFVCSTLSEAVVAIDTLMVKKVFGQQGARIVIQEKLDGKEVSMMAFCDGTRAVPLVAAQDYKRIFDRDLGPNTGGMGAVAPANRVRPTLFKKIHRLLTLAVNAMRQEGMPYKGILYAGVMVSGDDAYILEFNCRFGDPETQAQLPLLAGDLFSIINVCVDGNLEASLVKWHEQAVVCVVLASGGYPDAYTSGMRIHGLSSHPKSDVLVFHAGTANDRGHIKTNGGRVLSIVATGPNVQTARQKAYEYIGSSVSFEDMYYRRDIGV